jgi:hypothetical protein
VVSPNPHNFHAVLGVGKFAEIGEKFPVVAGKPREVKVVKKIAENDESPEMVSLEICEYRFGAAHRRSEMDVRNEQCVHKK